ncbi:MarR family transcriptional regulator [Frondihabitans australicus]|uniref:MarR family winged helix-turn-helix transcriptional regulator n=1 Tax=Frondihabitans australicus TaxID=386892 RepID=UPI000EABA048
MEDPLSLDRQVCFALAAASRSVIALYRPVLEPLGLTHPQYLVMLALWERSPRTVRGIGDALALDSATLSPLLKRLEAAGLLTRSRSAADERAMDVALTPAGAALRKQALAVPGQIVERLGLPLAQLERVRDELTELLAAARDSSPRGDGGERHSGLGSGHDLPRGDGRAGRADRSGPGVERLPSAPRARPHARRARGTQ